MKTLALMITTLLLSTQAHAFGSQVMTLECTSQHYKVAMEIYLSQADGFDIGAVKFQGRSVNGPFLTDVKMNTGNAATKLAFMSRKQVVALMTAKDMIESALDENSKALISVDGKTEPATCK